jgi:hypothetical protein
VLQCAFPKRSVSPLAQRDNRRPGRGAALLSPRSLPPCRWAECERTGLGIARAEIERPPSARRGWPAPDEAGRREELPGSRRRDRSGGRVRLCQAKIGCGLFGIGASRGLRRRCPRDPRRAPRTLTRMGIGGGPNPISAEATRKALNPDQERAAQAHNTSIEQAELDKAELRELEQSELYGKTPPASRRSFLRFASDREPR